MHARPSAQRWAEVVALADAWPVSSQRTWLLPYLNHHLRAWPESLRRAPLAWLRSSDVRLSLARRLSVRLTLWGPGGAGRRSLLRSLYNEGGLVQLEEQGDGNCQYYEARFMPGYLGRVAGCEVELSLRLACCSISRALVFERALRDTDAVVALIDSRAARSAMSSSRLHDLHDEMAHFFDRRLGHEELMLLYSRRDAPNILRVEEMRLRFNPGKRLSDAALEPGASARAVLRRLCRRLLDPDEVAA